MCQVITNSYQFVKEFREGRLHHIWFASAFICMLIDNDVDAFTLQLHMEVSPLHYRVSVKMYNTRFASRYMNILCLERANL